MKWNSTTIFLFIALGVMIGLLVYLIFFNKQKEKYEGETKETKTSSESETPMVAGYVVLFKMNGCGHCVNLMPSWNAAKEKCSEIAPTIKFVELEAEKINTQSYNLQGFPTIRFYPKEVSPEGTFIQYKGDRSTESIEKFALSRGKVNE